MNNNRVLILLMDSLGLGGAEDADQFGDSGADTFGHIAEQCARAAGNNKPNGILKLPNLEKKGLYQAALASRGKPIIDYDFKKAPGIEAAYGYAIEQSKGKDTPSGHWEIAGSPVLFDWHYFIDKGGKSCFPGDFIHAFMKKAKLAQGLLDAGHASGTEVINRLGDEHRKSLKPILYTSADSVLQIAAHEDSFRLEHLYEICNVARTLLDDMQINIGRVIARPFKGDKNGNYARTSNRHDYSVAPPTKTLLDHIKEENGQVISIGKIADIFANQGITKKIKATGIPELFEKSLNEFSNAPAGSLVFTNFVDFDSEYGHRRDITGYANALEYFDNRLPEIDHILKEDDMVVITADHGCDPSWRGTDHTREHIPFLYWGKKIQPGYIGARQTFSDIGQTIADFLEVKPLKYGKSSLQERVLNTTSEKLLSKQKIISLIDLTSLNNNDTPEVIEKLCNRAKTAFGNVAAVCIYPEFVSLAKALLKKTDIKVATVANFPSGEKKLSEILKEIEKALLDGADEIDVVIPYKDYIADGTSIRSIEIVRAAKKLCRNKTLKVIIESGSLKTNDLILKASEDAIGAGADFIKTSTGKAEIGATLDAADIMLKAAAGIKEPIGFKASGGVKTYEQSCKYLDLATKICGLDYCSNKFLRFGASSLLDDLLDN